MINVLLSKLYNQYFMPKNIKVLTTKAYIAQPLIMAVKRNVLQPLIKVVKRNVLLRK